MDLDSTWFDLLRCPRTGSPLHLVTGSPWPEFSAPEGTEMAAPFLVSEDGSIAYPIRDGIPDLLPESAICRERIS
ncbi:MAG: hypothetical protein OHK005_13220 [Candidatus Methylacidiphilales bacterium]